MGIAYRETRRTRPRRRCSTPTTNCATTPSRVRSLLGDLEYFGLDAFGDSSIVLKVRIKTWPGKQWAWAVPTTGW